MKTTKTSVILFFGFIAASCNNQKTISAEKSVNSKNLLPQQHQPARPSLDDIFKMDINRDGKLTKLEVTGPILEDFDKIDLNKDGFITREELGEAPNPQGPPHGRAGERPIRR